MAATNAGNCLNLFVGAWAGEEIIAPSKWGAGGVAYARISARQMLDSFGLIQDYRAERDHKSWLEVHAVFAFDGQSSVYRLFWFDSLGFTPEQPAVGHWDGEKLIFTRISPRGQTRHTYTFPGHEQYGLLLESSFDDGRTWSRVMRGQYARVPESTPPI